MLLRLILLLAFGLIACPAWAEEISATETKNTSHEWTIEQARHCWKPMTRAVQHVGVPGYQFQTGVMWDGALAFGPLFFHEYEVIRQEMAPMGNHLLHVSFGYGDKMSLIDRQGTNHPRICRWLEQGRLPIPHVQTRDGDLVWEETAFAQLLNRQLEPWPKPKPGDMLLTHVVFRVRNTSSAQRTGHLWMHFGDTGKVEFGYKCRQMEEIGKEIPFKFEAPFGRMEDKVRFVIPKPKTGTVRVHPEVKEIQGAKGTAKNVLEWAVPLAPGEEAELRLLLPYGLVRPAVAEKIAKVDSQKVFEEVKQFWRPWLYGPGQIHTPDAFVNDYLAAVAGQIAQQVAYREQSTQVWMYKTSPNNYENYWPMSGARGLPVFDLRGMGQLSTPLHQSIIDMRTSDTAGLNRANMGRGDKLDGEGFAELPGFLGNYRGWTANPLVLSHGLNLWALATHYRITRNDAWLRSGEPSPLAVMLEACDWISKQRRRTMRNVDGKPVPHWGLMPAASAHDWLAGNTIFNDAYCIVGMTEVVRLLREIEHPRAEELAKELVAYRTCLRDRYREARDRADRVPLADGTTIPYVPRIVTELDWTKPDWTYTSFSALRAGAWGALDPNGELVDQSLAFAEAGMPRGKGYYFPGAWKTKDAERNLKDVSDPKAERHYLWRHYVEYETMWPVGAPLFLARDDLPRFFEWFAHNFAFAIHQDFRVGAEAIDGVPACAPGDTERWMAVRNMFLREDGGYDGSTQSLWLLQAIPRNWLQPDDRLSMKEMGTTFGGTVDLSIQVSEDGGSVAVDASLNRLAVKPKEIRMRLRSGDGSRLVSASVNGSDVAVGPGDTIVLPSTVNGKFHIVGRFR